VVVLVAVSIVVSGVVEEEVVHSKEYPAIPLTPPSAPDHSISMVVSLYHVLVDGCEVLSSVPGFDGELESMKNGPRWICGRCCRQ